MSNKKDDQFFLDIVTEFVEVLIHQIIYLRDVYPASIFVSTVMATDSPVKLQLYVESNYG